MTFFSIAIPNDGEKSLTVMYVDGDIESVSSTHPNFDALVDLLNSGNSSDEEVQALINTNKAIGMKMAKVSERISVAPWGVFFDGDPLRGELSDTILQFYKDGDDEAMRTLVAFMEKAATNPNPKSIDALYRWVKEEKLTITETGDFIGYKAVHIVPEGGYTSVHSGEAIVDGVAVRGQIPYALGSVVEMPRSEVDPDSNHYCSVGLHIGTWRYAEWFKNHSPAQRVIMTVQASPRDVVMAPNDDSTKIRVCRYVIGEVIYNKVSKNVVASTDPTDNLSWKKGQLLRLSTNQGMIRVFAEEASSGDQSWLNGDRVAEALDVFENGRNSKGHFVKGFTPKGMVRLPDGKWSSETK